MRHLLQRSLLTLLLSGAAAHAQTSTAALSGTVIDTTGAVVAAADVTLVHDSTRRAWSTPTDSDGRFSFAFLPSGRYVLRVSRTGFAAAEIRDLTLEVDDQVALRVPLQLAGVSETVAVAAAVPIVQTSPAVSTLIGRDLVDRLPMNGRSFQSLILLTPGVVLTKTTFGAEGQFSVNGQRANANYFTVDGVSCSTRSIVPTSAIR